MFSTLQEPLQENLAQWNGDVSEVIGVSVSSIELPDEEYVMEFPEGDVLEFRVLFSDGIIATVLFPNVWCEVNVHEGTKRIYVREVCRAYCRQTDNGD